MQEWDEDQFAGLDDIDENLEPDQGSPSCAPVTPFTVPRQPRRLNLEDVQQEEEEISLTQLTVNQQKSVHLVTWSQADDSLLGNINNCNPRQVFGDLVVSMFLEQIDNLPSSSRGIELLHWACAREEHVNSGHHYHVAINFSSRIRWQSVSKRLAEEKGIFVNFQSFQTKYAHAWRYISKEDCYVYLSDNHPRMMKLPSKNMQPPQRHRGAGQSADQSASSRGSIPLPPSASSRGSIPLPLSQTNTQQSSQASNHSQSRDVVTRLSKIQVAQIITENDIRNETSLYSLSRHFLDAEQPELANFLINHSRDVQNLIKTAWLLNDAPEIESRGLQTCIERLREHLNTDHAVDEEHGWSCDGRWLRCALQILQRNRISLQLWQEKFQNCLRFGRGKKYNVFLLGIRNCGKTFLLRPLREIYKTFCSPATGSFNWVGAEESEVILLNDFRYPAIDKGADKIMDWQQLLNLLDSDPLYLQAPKNWYASNLEWTKRQPIFGNGPSKIQYIKSGEVNQVETDMMDARINYFHLTSPIPDDELDTTLVPCARCFAHLILNGSDLE